MHQSLVDRWNAVSLRTKITGVTVLMLTLGLLVSGIGTMAMLKPYLISQVDNQLHSAQRSLSVAVSLDPNPANMNSYSSSSDQYFVALLDTDGNMIGNNWAKHEGEIPPPIPSGLDFREVLSQGTNTFTVHDPKTNAEFRAAVIPIQFKDTQGTFATVFVALSTANVDNIMATYLAIFLGFGVIVVIVGAGLTRMLVTTTFSPLREVERTAAEIAEGDFSQRLDGATPNTEVGRLNRSLNTMLNRIDRAFNDRAKTIDQMRRFVGDASHELRTPLVSVRGYAELYRMGALQSSDEIAQAMERIEKEAIRMGGLVEDLLELARLDETKPLALKPVDLVPIARDAALDAMASAPGRRVTVLTPEPVPAAPSADIDDTVPPSPGAAKPLAGGGTSTGAIAFAGATFARLRNRRPRRPDAYTDTDVATMDAAPVQPVTPAAGPVIVLAEENKIRQVVTNLMGNAMRFTKPETPIEILVQVNYQADSAILEVIDHGEGIPPQIHEKIFQRFWRADTSRARETGGSGLGLAIVSSIVAAHNGTVEVTETAGGGATFRVSLPLAPPVPAALPAPAE
ncbi:MAG TPA: HAMP domain-containing sensor histidine kinase [Microbacteriaceae bacterium]|jgi:two-component system OmpR family sensor kinase|nr:HAMP domain-containing sensor histidine kinase [Microbacteriaceae bacterium]